jgi:MEMO1 family protein
MKSVSQLRPSPIAGMWYEDHPDQLSQQIDAYLRQAELPDLQGEVLALVAPHAGHHYSGHTAGYAFGCVAGKQYDLVAILSPMHQYHHAALLTSAHEGYDTPLGPVWIDREAVDELKGTLEREYDLGLASVANDREHSLEIELPFLQQALQPDFKILPVMVRGLSAATARALGKALAGVVKVRSSLMVASSDLSHFYPLEQAKVFDQEMLHQIESLSPEGVLQTEHSGRGYACGAVAIAAVLWAAQELGGNFAQILHHSTSASQTGDTQSVVGYGAVAILKRP